MGTCCYAEASASLSIKNVFLPEGETNNGEFDEIPVDQKLTKKINIKEINDYLKDPNVYMVYFDRNKYELDDSSENLVLDEDETYTVEEIREMLNVDDYGVPVEEVEVSIVYILSTEQKRRINPKYCQYFEKKIDDNMIEGNSYCLYKIATPITDEGDRYDADEIDVLNDFILTAEVFCDTSC